MTILVGKDIGRYHILEQLGEGGMAIVYKAYDTHLECDVAIKAIRTERLIPEMADLALKRFEREAKALARLTHPNIVKVTDYGEHEGQPYLVMPYYAGGTLKQWLGKPMPWKDAAQLLLPIARALDYAHKQEVIHRDVKPSNILITDAGEPLLTDFGIAKILDSQDMIELTGTSMTVGSPEYMAPEQVSSKTVDNRADIYALGIVFYEMVTGRKPYIADTPLAVLLKHASEPLPRPQTFVKDLPDIIEQVLLKALAKNPSDRYQDMGEFSRALERLSSDNINQMTVPLADRHNDSNLASEQNVEGKSAAESHVASANRGAGKISGPSLVSDSGYVFELVDDETLIGRRDEKRGITSLDIDLTDLDIEQSVSRKHAKILYTMGAYKILDLSSTNGTRINDVQITPETPTVIQNGDHIRLGDIGLTFLEGRSVQ